MEQMLTRAPLRVACLLLIVLTAYAVPSRAQDPNAPERAALVTLLGEDTLAVERWERTAGGVDAVAAVRAPRTSLRHYELDLAPDGTMRRFVEAQFDPSRAGEAPLRTVTVEAADGHWVRTVTEGGSTESERIEAGAGLLPFIELVSWPFELVLLRGAGEQPTTQPLLAGSRTLDYTVTREAPDRVILAHPYRGPSVVRVDEEGRLLSLDASETTRKVTVTRVPWLDVEAIARRWAAADAAGRSVGELSGRAEPTYEVSGANIALDYGTPSKRGRDIFGIVVPWNEVWRTGANRATHITTDRMLVLGSGADTLVVPAGTYTLFSIPAPDGGVLIVNRQTDQGGTSYDAAQDLGRVPMQLVRVEAPVERFTIRADPNGDQAGVLRLVWDRSEFHVPFVVR